MKERETTTFCSDVNGTKRCVYIEMEREREREKNFEFKFSLGTNNIELKCSSFLGAQIKIKNGFSFKFFYF